MMNKVQTLYKGTLFFSPHSRTESCSTDDHELQCIRTPYTLCTYYTHPDISSYVMGKRPTLYAILMSSFFYIVVSFGGCWFFKWMMMIFFCTLGALFKIHSNFILIYPYFCNFQECKNRFDNILMKPFHITNLGTNM